MNCIVLGVKSGILLNVFHLGFPGGSVGKESACNARDLDSVPGLEISPGEGNGNLFQYSHLKNSIDRGVGQAEVHGIAESDTTVRLIFTFSLSPYPKLFEISCCTIELMLN